MRSVALLCVLCACSPGRATRAECERILERIVDIELKERGYKDPMLQTIKHTTFKRKLERDLEACVGRKLKRDAMSCIETATSVETISHECLGGDRI